jgi:hypothetical protein
MQSSLVSFSLRFKYSPRHSVLKHPHRMFSHTVRDQVSHPYRSTRLYTEADNIRHTELTSQDNV